MRSSITPSTRRSQATARTSRLRSKRAISSALPITAAAFPCGIHPQMGIPTLEVVLTVLHAGGKFDGSRLQGIRRSARRRLIGRKRAVRLAGGRGPRRTHQALHAASERGVTTVRDARYAVRERDRHDHSLPRRTRRSSRPRSTSTMCCEKRLREQAFLNAGLQITLRDERDDEPVEEVMHYEGGIRQFVEHLNRTKTPLHERGHLHGGQPRHLDGRGRHAVHRQLQRADAVLRQQYQHHRGRHARDRLQGRSDPCAQRLRQEIQAAQGRRVLQGRGRARGSDRDHLGQAARRRSSRARPRPSSATAKCVRWWTRWFPRS